MKSKNKNVLLLFIIFIITGILFYVTYNGYGPGHRFSYRNIEKGLDLSGGVYIVYEAQEETENLNNKDDNYKKLLEEKIIKMGRVISKDKGFRKI